MPRIFIGFRMDVYNIVGYIFGPHTVIPMTPRILLWLTRHYIARQSVA